MGFNCSYFQYLNVSPPDVSQQMEVLGTFGPAVAIAGAVSTVFLTVLFIFSLYHVVRRNPPSRRRILVWLTSFPMIISFLALVTFVVPRTAILTDMVKQSYMPFLLVHFVDLSMTMEGGQTETLRDIMANETPLSLDALPCCCVGLCFRNVTYSKKKMRFQKALVYQMPLLQLIILAFTAIFENAGILNRVLSDVLFLIMVILYVVFFITGMWAFNVLTAAIAVHTKWNRYYLKSRVLSLSIILLKVQTAILMLLTLLNVIPCYPPVVSNVVMRKTIDAALTLLESFIFGIFFYLAFREVEYKNRLETTPDTPRSNCPTPFLVSNTIAFGIDNALATDDEHKQQPFFIGERF